MNWSREDAARVKGAGRLLRPYLPDIVADFCEAVEQIGLEWLLPGQQRSLEGLKERIWEWLTELFAGRYGPRYVARRWSAGWRHARIGLDQAIAAVAFTRIRLGLLDALAKAWRGKREELYRTAASLNKLLDLDLALVQDAYRTEYFMQLERRSEATFRNLVEAAACMIVILRPDFTLVYLSPHGEELTGHAAEAVEGKNYMEVFVPADQREQFRAKICQALASQPARGWECPVICRDGSHRWLIWNARRLGDYRGSPAVLAVGQDITPLKIAQERALQSEQLAVVGQMVTMLAHETRNAFQLSQAHLEEVAAEIEDRPETRGHIEQIKKAQGTIQHLFEDIRRYVAPIFLHYELSHLGEVVEEAWAYLAVARRGRQAQLHSEVSEASPYCEVDRFRIEQVFRNLFDNSLAACADPVHIYVRYAEARLSGRPALRISVSDNGPGLNEEQRERIFEPFYTTKPHGTGLGMAIVKRIVEAHGGSVEVGNSGPGAEICLTLPRRRSYAHVNGYEPVGSPMG